MEELQVWQYNTHEIRTVTKEGEPWFVAKDIMVLLELDNTAMRRIDETDKGKDSILTPGGLQPMVVVNESGMYSLVLGSRKPEALAFKRWVTGTVLPQIRKTGSYTLPSAKNVYGILRGLVDDLERQDQAIAAVSQRVDKIAQGIPALPVPENASQEYVTPTQLGKMSNPRLSGQQVNVRLQYLGLQFKVGGEWIPTEHGKQYAKTLPIQLVSTGACVYQTYWQRRVYDLLCEVTA